MEKLARWSEVPVRIRELEQQNAKLKELLAAERDLSNEYDLQKDLELKTLTAERDRLREVVHELPYRLSARFGRPALSAMLQELRLSCLERGVQLDAALRREK